MLRALAKLLGLALGVYAMYAALLYSKQRMMMFPLGYSEPAPFRAKLPLGARYAERPASFGVVRVVLLPARDAVARMPAILFAHGNGERIEDDADAFESYVAQGLNVALYEFPGYGGAPGEPGFDTLIEASSLAFDWLATQPEVDRDAIVSMGYSIGGAPACELVRHRPVRALIALSTFTSMAAFARAYHLPAFLVRDPYDSLQRMREFAGPVLVAHGRRDQLIPFVHGQMLARAAPHGRFIAQLCGHDDCGYLSPAFAQTVVAFLRDNGLLDP